MSSLAAFLWIFNVALHTVGQLSFKAAAGDPRAGDGLMRWRYMAGRPWLWLGVGCYVVEFPAWIAFLSLLPLSVGVLLGAIDTVVIMLAAHVLFREKLTVLRVTGVLLVTAGVTVVGWGG